MSSTPGMLAFLIPLVLLALGIKILVTGESPRSWGRSDDPMGRTRNGGFAVILACAILALLASGLVDSALRVALLVVGAIGILGAVFWLLRHRRRAPR